MNYKEAKNYAKTIGQRGMVLGLESMKQLLFFLDNPQKKLKVVHVAGTNGKGSVIAYLSEMLIRAGYKTGTYVSPAVFEPLEIYQINHENMTEECYGQLMDTIRDAVDKMLKNNRMPPTLFEVETALALLYFAREACDIVFMETGLGGALDATNCIDSPLCCVLTSISFDHRAILGDTLEEIAAQKAGIIKEHCYVVCSPQKEEVISVIEQVCRDKRAVLAITDEKQIHCERMEGALQRKLKYKEFPLVELGLLGQYQLENAATALEVIRVLRQYDYVVTDAHIEEGISRVRWQGRLTVLSERPLIIMDGAHNEAAAIELGKVIKQDFPDKKWIYIMGVLADKEYNKVLEYTMPFAKQVITITPENARALSGEALEEAVSRYGVCGKYASTIQEALEEALSWCQEEEDRSILAFGSFTFLNELKEAVHKKMLRLNQLIKHSVFLEKLEQIEQLEQNRQFCRHGWEHCVDVARTMALLNEERTLGFSKELLYAMAFVHDLGRGEEYINGTSHEEAGAGIAEQLLAECGFSEEERQAVISAVQGHRNNEAKSDALTRLLIEADKKTRMCFRCRAWNECKWSDNKKNRMIEL